MTFILFALNLILFLVLSNLFDFGFSQLGWIAAIHFLFSKMLLDFVGHKALMAFLVLAVQFGGLFIAASYLADNQQTRFFIAVSIITFASATISTLTKNLKLSVLLIADSLALTSSLEFASTYNSPLVYDFRTSLTLPMGIGLIFASCLFAAKYCKPARNQSNLAAKKSNQ